MDKQMITEYHVENTDNSEDTEGQELEGAVLSARKDPTVPKKPVVDKPHNDQSPDGEEG